MNSRSKSLKLNMLLNTIKGILSFLFPLISFPYASRILGVDNIGKFNFSNSIISYFILLSGLGISTYAIREGARIRNNGKDFKKFANEMFTINVLSTITSYLLLAILIRSVSKLENYRTLLIILSLQIAFKTIGIEWIYSIFEDYLYITVRSIVFQILSLVLLFLFVKNEKSINIYALITLISTVGSNLLNYIHAIKYCKVSITKSIDWKRHIKPILVLFAMSITVTIYVSSDTTILGLLCGNYNVGIYSVSVKIYNIVKSILASVLVVSIPRLSVMLGKQDYKSFEFIATDIYKTLITILLPSVAGIIILRKEIVLIISDITYINAVSSLAWLSMALICCLGAWFWGQCILVPYKKEIVVFKSTLISALLNLILNFILIPIWKENAAAFTTFLAEGLTFLWCMLEGKKLIILRGIKKTVLKVIIGCVGIVVTAFIVNFFNLANILYTVITIILSIIIYLIVEIALNNTAVTELFDRFLIKKIRKQGENTK